MLRDTLIQNKMREREKVKEKGKRGTGQDIGVVEWCVACQSFFKFISENGFQGSNVNSKDAVQLARGVSI